MRDSLILRYEMPEKPNLVRGDEGSTPQPKATVFLNLARVTAQGRIAAGR